MKDQVDEHRLSLSPHAQKLNSNLNMTPSLPNTALLTAARLQYICFTVKPLLFLSAGLLLRSVLKFTFSIHIPALIVNDSPCRLF